MTRDWQVLIPLKSLTRAKTRVEADSETRARLALAMCRDVVAAVQGSPRVAHVHVIAQDRRVATTIRTTAARAWGVPRGRGLNQELAAAMSAVRVSHGVAAVLGDIPCLTSEVFTEILESASRRTASFVTGIDGQGTTMLLNPPFVRVAPKFGTRSAIKHGAWAMSLTGGEIWMRARRDVDTLDDLAVAQRLSSGPATAALCRARGISAIRWGSGTEVPVRADGDPGQDLDIVGL